MSSQNIAIKLLKIKSDCILKKIWSRLVMIASLLTIIGGVTGCSDELNISDPANSSEGGIKVEAGTTLYSAIRLLSVEGVPTRGEADDIYGNDPGYDADFEAGNPEDESRIDNILIVFYEQYGDYIGHFTANSGTISKKDPEDENGNIKDDGLTMDKDSKGDNKGIIENLRWGAIVPVEIEVAESIDIEKINNYVVILNYNDNLLKRLENAGGEKPFPKRADLYEEIINAYQLSDNNVKKGFLMTTSGHFNDYGDFIWQGTKPNNNQIIYTTEADARANPLPAYVERLAVKIQFNLKQVETVEVLHGTDVYGLVFYPDFWGVEAEEKESYINKHLDQSSTNDFKKDMYPADFYDWVQYYNIRCFWAMSKDYNNEDYPVLGTEDRTKFPLRYYTFNGLKNENYKLIANTSSDDDDILTVTCTDKPYYTLEHTFPNSLYNSNPYNAYNPYGIPTSVVLRGQYKVKYMGTDEKEAGPRPTHPGDEEDSSKGSDDEKENEENPEPGNTLKKGDEISLNGRGFYIRPIDMERTDLGSNLPKSYKYSFYLEKSENDENELLTAMLKEQYMIWQVVEEEDESEDGEVEKVGEEGNSGEEGQKKEKIYKPIHDNDLGIFIIANTKKRNDEKDADFYNASNTYTLQIDPKKLEGKEIYLKTKASDKYKLLTSDDDLKEANKALQNQLGYAQYYFQGYAFFYAPIPHYSGKFDPFTAENPFKGIFNYEKNGKNYKVNHKTGDFGVVRNHIYNVNINNITDLGYGIPDENIIPLPEPRPGQELHQFDMELKILPWHIYEYTFDI